MGANVLNNHKTDTQNKTLQNKISMEETVIICFTFKPRANRLSNNPALFSTILPDLSPRSNRKPIFGQRSTLIKHMTLTSYKPEPAIWSRGTGQRITWFDRCQLIITWCHISKKYKTKAACLCQPIIWRLAAIFRVPPLLPSPSSPSSSCVRSSAVT